MADNKENPFQPLRDRFTDGGDTLTFYRPDADGTLKPVDLQAELRKVDEDKALPPSNPLDPEPTTAS